MEKMDYAMTRADELARAQGLKPRSAYVYEKFGVPLLWIFPYREVEFFRAYERAKNPDGAAS
jgi:hypothetical protein